MKQLDLSNINVLRVRHTLVLATQAYAQLKRQIPKEKITKRIEELKYLTAQKKVPRLSVRKEVLHLEEQLNSILNVEKALQEQEHKESERVTALKKQNAFLRKRLATTEDKDLQKKVDKLSHLLAEAVARKDIRRDVALSQRVAAVVKPKQIITPLAAKPSVDLLQQKLLQLKQMLEQQKEQGAALEVTSLLENRVKAVEEKINSLKEEKSMVKHTMIMSAPVIIKEAEDQEFSVEEDKE